MKVQLFYMGLFIAVSAAQAEEVVDGAIVPDSTESTSNALQGKRLFFAPRERISSDNMPGDIASGTSAGEHSNVPTATADPLSMSTKPGRNVRGGSTFVLIQYDALLQSNTSLCIIVNGIPCAPINRSEFFDDASDQVLACPSLKTAGLRLLLLKDGKSIQVTRNAVDLGVLFPGQGL